MGLREFISKSRPGFRAAFFWFVGSKRGVGVEKPLDIVSFAPTGHRKRGTQFPLWGESLSRPEGATSRRRRIDVCGGGWGFTRWMDRGVVWSLDRIQRVISFFLIPLLL